MKPNIDIFFRSPLIKMEKLLSHQGHPMREREANQLRKKVRLLMSSRQQSRKVKNLSLKEETILKAEGMKNRWRSIHETQKLSLRVYPFCLLYVTRQLNPYFRIIHKLLLILVTQCRHWISSRLNFLSLSLIIDVCKNAWYFALLNIMFMFQHLRSVMMPSIKPVEYFMIRA